MREDEEVPVLTVREVAARLRISRNAAYALCREPGFPAAWVGGQIRIPSAAFEHWLKGRSGARNGERQP